MNHPIVPIALSETDYGRSVDILGAFIKYL